MRSDPYPRAELDAITDWQSLGGLAEFTSGGCGTGGQTLCAEVEGRTTNDCGDRPRLQAEKKGCIIATSTYGSELSPEVQFLREFRDDTVLNTFAGSGFMKPRRTSLTAIDEATPGLKE